MAGLKTNEYWRWRNRVWEIIETEPFTVQSSFMLLEAIAQCFNKAKWPDSLRISNKRLEAMVNCGQSTLDDRRKELVRRGLIEVDKGHKNTAATYRIIPVHRIYNTDDSGDDSGDSSGTPEHNKTLSTNNKEREAPALDEVKAYWQESGFINSDPEAFYDYYTDKGWGKSWKAKARNWERKERTEYKALDREQAVAEIAQVFASNDLAATAAKDWVNGQYDSGECLTAKEIKLIRPALLPHCKDGQAAADRFADAKNLEALLNGYQL